VKWRFTLRTAGQLANHPAIKNYYVTGYPTLILIDKQGRLGANPVMPLDDRGKDLARLIDQALAEH
jgi:hypothetical protein